MNLGKHLANIMTISHNIWKKEDENIEAQKCSVLGLCQTACKW